MCLPALDGKSKNIYNQNEGGCGGAADWLEAKTIVLPLTVPLRFIRRSYNGIWEIISKQHVVVQHFRALGKLSEPGVEL